MVAVARSALAANDKSLRPVTRLSVLFSKLLQLAGEALSLLLLQHGHVVTAAATSKEAWLAGKRSVIQYK